MIDFFDYIIKVERTSKSMTVQFKAFVFGSSEGGSLFMTCDFRVCPLKQLCAPPTDCWGSDDADEFMRSKVDLTDVRPSSQFSFQLSVPEIKGDATTTNEIGVHDGIFCMTEAIAYLTFASLGVVTVLLLCSICAVVFLIFRYCKSTKFYHRRRCESDRSVVRRVYVQTSKVHAGVEPMYVPQQPSLFVKGYERRELQKDYARDIADPTIYSIIIPYAWAERANALAHKNRIQARRRLSLDENRHLSRPEIENWSLGNANYRRRLP
uniref:ZP domain-containing protein n=1 Tax=Plectus sambesii TaxID=2011161 RepID=A0A914VQY2_9BILA